MPAEHFIDDNARLIITTWEGKIVDIDLIEALKKYQKDIQTHHDYLDYNEVVDFSKATGIKLTAAGLKNLGVIAARTDQKDVRRKLALIVGSNTAFFLARMYTGYRSFSRNSNKDVRVFTKEKVAFDWATSR